MDLDLDMVEVREVLWTVCLHWWCLLILVMQLSMMRELEDIAERIAIILDQGFAKEL